MLSDLSAEDLRRLARLLERELADAGAWHLPEDDCTSLHARHLLEVDPRTGRVRFTDDGRTAARRAARRCKQGDERS